MNIPLFTTGLIIMIISHPKILSNLARRFINEGIAKPKPISPQKNELIKYAGPNLSLFTIGFVIIIISFVVN